MNPANEELYSVDDVIQAAAKVGGSLRHGTLEALLETMVETRMATEYDRRLKKLLLYVKAGASELWYRDEAEWLLEDSRGPK